MKKCCLLMFVLLCSCIAHAMHHEINKVDDVPYFCLDLERRLSVQPLFSGINRSDKGPCRVMQLNQREEALFEWLSQLAGYSLEIGNASLASTISRVKHRSAYTFLAQQGAIEYGIFRSQDDVADLSAIERTMANIVRDIKSGWSPTPAPSQGSKPAVSGRYYILRKRQDPSKSESEIGYAEDRVIELLIDLFGLRGQTHFINNGLDVQCVNDNNRYLWIKQEAFDRFQLCFGFDIVQTLPPPVLKMTVPDLMQTTPLHGAAAQMAMDASRHFAS